MQIEQLKQQIQENKPLIEIIQITPYLPFAHKQVLCLNVVNSCLEQNDDGLLTCNFFTKKLMQDISILVNYTDFETSENLLEDYDILCQDGILELMLNSIDKKEIKFIEEMVDKSIEQTLRLENSIESIVSKGLNKLLDKLPTDKQLKSLSKSLVKDLGKLDINKINELKDMFGIVGVSGGGKVN